MRKISVITACLNNAETLEAALRSVRLQDHPAVEHIVVDGGSTDGTAELLAKYQDHLGALMSEKDEGVYHALNKGLAKASGEVIAVLHADDFYPDPGVLSRVARAFEEHGTDCVYGDVRFVRRHDPARVVRYWKASSYEEGLFLRGWMPPHPAFFLKREWYERYGCFNTALSISADYELMLRMLHKHKLTAHYVPETLVVLRSGGTSNRSLVNRIKANLEDRKAWRMNGLRPGAFTLFLKPLGKVSQYVNIPSVC